MTDGVLNLSAGSTSKGVTFFVDQCDEWLLFERRWFLTRKGYVATHVSIAGKRKLVRLHRVIMGAAPGSIVDHIDGNKLNNSRSNLRFVTPSQNRMNARRAFKGGASASRFKGVSFVKKRNMWKLAFGTNGKQKTIGYFSREEDAARKYNELAKASYGEYARLNDVP